MFTVPVLTTSKGAHNTRRLNLNIILQIDGQTIWREREAHRQAGKNANGIILKQSFRGTFQTEFFLKGSLGNQRTWQKMVQEHGNSLNFPL